MGGELVDRDASQITSGYLQKIPFVVFWTSLVHVNSHLFFSIPTCYICNNVTLQNVILQLLVQSHFLSETSTQ